MKQVIKNFKYKNFLNTSSKGFYRGEILNRKPNGYGIFVMFNDNEAWAEINMPASISDIYLGEWKNGEYHGQGRFIEYAGLEWGSDKYGMPNILNEKVGNFKKGKIIGPYYVYQFPEKKKWSCFKRINKKTEKIKNKDSYIPGLFSLKEVTSLLDIDVNTDIKTLKEEFSKRYLIMTKKNILKNHGIMDMWKSNIIPSSIKPNTKFNIKLLYLLIQIPVNEKK